MRGKKESNIYRRRESDRKRGIIVKVCIALVVALFIVLYLAYSITVKHKKKANEEKPIADQDVITKEDDQEIREDSKGGNQELNEDSKEDLKDERIDGSNETMTGLKIAADVASTYTILATLNHEEEWVNGKIDGAIGSITTDSNFLTLNQYLPVEASDFVINTNSSLYRILVNQYNGDNHYIGSVDLADGDILHIDDVVKYITITLYEYKNRKVVDCSEGELMEDLQQGNSISITHIEDLEQLLKEKESFANEVHLESLSNYYNYRYGWYQSWGGEYEYTEGSMCTRNFYQVDNEPYVLNVNDSRIVVNITEYDEDGKWLKYNDSLANGDTFQKQPSTAYIGITIASRKWGINLFSLFQNGLRIDLASEQYVKNTDTIPYSEAKLGDLNHWKSGSYLYETGEYTLDYSKVCLDSFCQIDDKEYTISLPNSYLRMSILELNEDGDTIRSENLQNGQTWRKSEATYKIAISIYDSQSQYALADYQEAIRNATTIGLIEYVRYQHNTKMNELSVWELIENMKLGWNLGNSLDSKSEIRSQTDNLKQELNWGNPYVTKKLIDTVAEYGFDTIRIPVTWYYNTYEDETGHLKIREEWLNRIQEVVDYAIANDVYVILNTHHEQPILYAGVEEGSWKKVLFHAKELWTEIAEYFKTYDEHLIFEAYNEVDNLELSWNYSDLAAEQMNELNQVFVDAVRATGGNNTNRILVVPTLLDGASERFCSAFELPKDKVANKIMVEVHLYSQKLNDEIEPEFELLEQFSKRIGAPVIIGEFGTTNQSVLPELRAKQASNFVARAAEHGLKCIWWDDGSEFKIIDRRDTKASDVNLIEALMDGTRGIAYQVESKVTVCLMNQFVYRMPNLNTGILENTSWGTLTLNLDWNGIPVEAGKILTISMKVRGEASSVKLQRVLFYKVDGLLVESGIELKSMYYQGIVPENATNMRVSLNSATKNITQKEFEEYLKAGDLVLELRMFQANEVEQIQLQQQ